MAEDGSTDWVPMEDTQFGNGDTQATGGREKPVMICRAHSTLTPRKPSMDAPIFSHGRPAVPANNPRPVSKR